VQRGTQYGVLDALGNPIIPEIWSFLKLYEEHKGSANSFLEGTWLECRSKLGFGVLKLNGQIVLEPVYQSLGYTNKSLFIVKLGARTAW
jgi:hypothetical protein